MTESITDKQADYLKYLLREHLGSGLGVWLKEKHDVGSIHDLSKSEASSIIDVFADESEKRKQTIAEAEQIINEEIGQEQMF